MDMIRNLPNAAGYSDSQGDLRGAQGGRCTTPSRRASAGVTLDDIYLGNGVSELIVMAMNALLDNGDEVLVPAPDYPLWTAAVSLSGGTPVHYLCDEADELAARPRRHPRQDHAAHQGASWSSTRTTRPARCIRNAVLQRASSRSPASTA